MSEPFVGARFTAVNTNKTANQYNLISGWVASYATTDIYDLPGNYIYVSRAGFYVIRALISIPSSALSDYLTLRLDVPAGQVFAGVHYGEAGSTQNQLEYETHLSGQTANSQWPGDIGLRLYGFHNYGAPLTYDAEISIRRVGP
jgi:hypothetical protein